MTGRANQLEMMEGGDVRDIGLDGATWPTQEVQ